MADHNAPEEQPRWPRVMQSTRRKMVQLHEDGTATHTTCYVVHAPGVEPADWTAIVEDQPAGWGRP